MYRIICMRTLFPTVYILKMGVLGSLALANHCSRKKALVGLLELVLNVHAVYRRSVLTPTCTAPCDAVLQFFPLEKTDRNSFS